MDDVELGKRVRAARVSAGWSVRKLADAIELDPASLSRTESGTRALKARELVALCAALGRSIPSVLEQEVTDLDAARAAAWESAEPVGVAVAKWLDAVAVMTAAASRS